MMIGQDQRPDVGMSLNSTCSLEKRPVGLMTASETHGPGSPSVTSQTAVMMAARLGAEGVEVSLDLVPDVPHVWHFWHGYLPEADAALDRAASFLRRVLPPAG